MIDTTTPCMGPFRLPNDNERRCRLIFTKPFRDCVDVCEMNPDLEEKTDATMRLFRDAPVMLKLLEQLMHDPRDLGAIREAEQLIASFKPSRFPARA